MSYKIFCCGTLLLSAVIFSGCSDSQVPDPPSARAELTGRLYEALQYKRDAEALAIINKLLALEPDDVDLLEMRDRVTVNACTRAVQTHVNSGNLDKALQVVNKYRQEHSTLPGLKVLQARISELILLRDCAANLAAANDISTLVTQLEKIAPLAAKYPQAKQLQQDIKMRRIQLARMRAEAAAKAQLAADAPAPGAKAAAPAAPAQQQ